MAAANELPSPPSPRAGGTSPRARARGRPGRRRYSSEEEEVVRGPGLRFTSSARVPDWVKIRKKFGIWPLDLQVGFDLDPREVRIRNWVCSCREKLLGGDIGLDLNRQEVAYSKTLEMQGGSRLAITASVNYDSLLLGGHPRPTVGVNLLSNLPGLDGLQRSTLTQENQFDLQTEVPITRNVHVELCANATVPLPAARYSMSEAGAELRVGDGDWHLHLSEVNAVYRL